MNDLRNVIVDIEESKELVKDHPRDGIEKKIKASLNLVIVENNVLKKIENLTALSAKILNNEKYHWMSESFMDNLSLGEAIDNQKKMMS